MPPRDPLRLGVSVAPKPGESGMSLLLRAFQANGVDYQHGMRWLGLDRRRGIGEHDVGWLAWALNVDADDLKSRLAVLEWRGGGRWVHLGNQRLSRWIAPTTMMAKLCPVCLRETGIAEIAWMTRLAPACVRHGVRLIQQCGNCGKPIRWTRPGLQVCVCGRFFKPSSSFDSAPPHVLAWLAWAQSVLQGDAAAAEVALMRLPSLLHGMSLDGAYRMVEAFGLLQVASTPVRELRHGAASLEVVGAVLGRGLERLAVFAGPDDASCLPFDVVHLPIVRELAETPACDADGQRAAWLLDLHRAARPSGVRRVGARPRRQLPLFL